MNIMKSSILLVSLLFAFVIETHAVTENEFRTLESKMEAMELRMALFEKREAEQQKTILRQQETIRHQDVDIADMRQQRSTDIERLTHMLTDQNLTLVRQSKKIEWLEKHHRPSHTKTKTTTVLKNKQLETDKIITESAGIKNGTRTFYFQTPMSKRLVLSDGESPVAFMINVSNKTIDNIGIDQDIIFDNVVLNLGNGYNVNHGIFTVPVSGIYLITASLLFDNSASLHADAAIVLNGENVARMYTHGQNGDWGHTTHTIVIQVSQGDEIWVRNIDFINSKVYGYGYSSFSGYLLMQM